MSEFFRQSLLTRHQFSCLSQVWETILTHPLNRIPPAVPGDFLGLAFSALPFKRTSPPCSPISAVIADTDATIQTLTPECMSLEDIVFADSTNSNQSPSSDSPNKDTPKKGQHEEEGFFLDMERRERSVIPGWPNSYAHCLPSLAGDAFCYSHPCGTASARTYPSGDPQSCLPFFSHLSITSSIL